MKKNWIYFLLGFIAVALLGAKQFYDNTLILGNSQASNKEVIFDIGQGANNPKIKWDNAAGILKVSNGSAIFSEAGSPVGSIMAYAGSSAPDGWILAQGQAVSRTTYAKLFTAIGTTYGVGDGSTTFNLPDLRGRVVAGVDAGINRLTSSTLGSSATLGITGGSEGLSSHLHGTGTLVNSTSTASGTTNIGGIHSHNVDAALSDHNHTLSAGAQAQMSANVLRAATFTGSSYTATRQLAGGLTTTTISTSLSEYIQVTGNAVANAPSSVATNNAPSHDHIFSGSVTAQTISGSTASTGSGTHGVVQPTIVLNYIIKA